MTRTGGGIILVATVGLFKSKDKPAGAGPGPKNCPTCGKSAEWVAQYSKHYCRSCSKYLDADPPKPTPKAAESKPMLAGAGPEKPAKPVAKKLGPACPTCGKSSEWVAAYSRHYCRNCSKYLDDAPAAPASPSKPAAKAPEPVAEEVGPSSLPENELAERSEGPAVPPGMGSSPTPAAEPKPAFDPYKPMVIRTDTAGMVVKEEPALKAPEEVAAVVATEPPTEPARPATTASPAPVAAVPVQLPAAPIVVADPTPTPAARAAPTQEAPVARAAPQTSSKSGHFCENCGKPMKAIEAYGRYYCYDCKIYGPEIPGAKPKASAAPKPVDARPTVAKPQHAPPMSAAAASRTADVPPPPDDEPPAPAVEREVELYPCPGCQEQVYVGWEKCPVCTIALPYYPYKDWGPA